MKKFFVLVAMFLLLLSFNNQSLAVTIDLIESGDDPISILSGALLAPSSGINIISGSQTFVGSVGDGDLAQSATYSNFSLISNNSGLPTISNPDGIMLTSGTANIPMTNTSSSFSVVTNTGSDTDLVNILNTASAPSSEVLDVNYFSFDFTVSEGITSIEADFVFASDEFPDQLVTDVFAFIVDDTNYAFFQDGSLVSFVVGQNSSNFNNNSYGNNNYNFEYDGISNSLHVIGLLNPNLSEHTLKIAIADTADNVFDSAVFMGNLIAGTSTGGGIDDNNPIPEPTTMILFGLGLLGVAGVSRRKN